ncbi:MAG: addiction module toxin RelE [Candidatus Schekmanbacteria bacterium GWA2_38_11]|uniref:Addiction module toxin RelE n=1 Tax=Candidatus Schekmanbacteria bacterium GWA2_38_11 TaxID=1817876 RepID=A0A1F7R9C1_9BACT|nr:MAG: addiction module toxin RelE [Candidatus Schekmanbacteria bacterium GWA2_38_11]
MKLLGKELLHDFKEKHADARSQIESWEAEVEEAQWNTPQDLKRRYPKASLPGNQQAVFDICWNKYRLLVKVNYKNGIVLIKKIGTHKEYDNWNIS